MKKFLLLLLALAAMASPGWAVTVENETNLRTEVAKQGNTVTLANPITLTGTLVITQNVTLDGSGFTLSGNNKFRVIKITGGKVTIQNLTITGEQGPEVEEDEINGGGILLEGGTADVTIENCTFRGNKTGTYSSGGGGGIYHKQGTLTVRNCRFERNSASDGGGIYGGNNSGKLTVSECTFISNDVGVQGGGIHLDYKDGDSITNCTFTENSILGNDESTAHGGGIYMSFVTDENTINNYTINCVANCTFVNNTGVKGSEIFCNLTNSGSKKINNIIINSLLWNDGDSTKEHIIGTSGSTGTSVTLDHCAVPKDYALPEGITSPDCVTVAANWTPVSADVKDESEKKVLHRVFKIEDNLSALSGLIGKGISTDITPTNDQLGSKRRAPLTIGAVEYGGKMDFTLAATGLDPTGDSQTYSGYIGQAVKLTPDVTPAVFATGNQWEWDSKSPSTALPGLTLNAATGVISGTPNADIKTTTDYHFTLKATSGDYTASRDLTLRVSPITLKAKTKPELIVTAGEDLGTDKTVIFTPTPAGLTYTWRVNDKTEDTTTAPGVTATIANGTLTFKGKPEKPGNYTFNVTASADIGGVTRTSAASAVNLIVSLKSVTVTPFEIPFEETEGIPKISFEATAGIPFKKDIEFWMYPDLNYTCYVNDKYEDKDTAPGMTATTWNGTANFTLSGTPTQAGEYTFTFKATTRYGNDPIVGTAEVKLTVKEKSSESGSQDIDAVEKLLINFVAGGITVEQGKTDSTTLTATVLGKYNNNEYVDLSDIAECKWTLKGVKVEGKPDWLKQEENGNKVTFTVGPEAAEGWYEFNVWVTATVRANGKVISSSYGEDTLEKAGMRFIVWVKEPAPVVTDLDVTANTAAMDATVGTHATLDLGEYVAVMKKWSDGTTTPAPDAALTFAPGDGWPSWLTLASNGTVTATPTADAATETTSYPYSVTASVGGLPRTGSGTLNVTVISNLKPAGITTTKLPDAKIGKNYSAEINATGTKPIKWEIVKGDLPRGLSLDPLTGRISGAPALVELKEAGKYPFTVRVSNGVDGTGEYPAEREFTLKVKETPPGKSWKVTLSNSEKKAQKKKSVGKGKTYFVTFVQKNGENLKYTNKTSKKDKGKGGIQKFIPTNKPEAGMGKGVFMCRNTAKKYFLRVGAANSAGGSSITKKVKAKKKSVRLAGIQAALSGAAWAGLAADDEDDDDDELDGDTENDERLTYYANGEVDEDGNISAVIGTAVPNVEGAEYVYATVNDMLSALAGKSKKVIGLEFRTGTKVDTSRLRELPNLTDLSIDEGDVTEINLSGLSSLESLSLYGCRNLTSLNVSGCSSLSVVMVDECSKLVMLTGVKGCTELESLSLHGAAITALDVNGFELLANLDVTGCEKLASLNAAGCTALETLSANGCSSLTGLVLTGVTTLTDVSLDGTKITDLDLSECVGQNALVTGQAHGSAVFATAGDQDDDDDEDDDDDDLEPAATGLKTLPLANATELTSLVLPDNSVFELFKLTGSKVKELDLSGIISMDALDLSRNKRLETLNVSSNDVLKELDVSGNEALKTLNVSNCATLEKLTANDCAALYSLNIEGCPALRELELYGAKWLTELNCAGRRLGHLDLDGLTRLSKLECGKQKIGGVPMTGTTLDLTPYAGYNPSRVKVVQGYAADGAEIETQWNWETGTATFASVPATVWYVYDTGLRGETMDVTLTAAPLSDGPTSDKDGGGCDAGFAGIAAAAVLGLAATKKRK